jgi:protein-disulfide isomerase
MDKTTAAWDNSATNLNASEQRMSMSKRQQMRAKRRRQQIYSRLGIIGAISLIAIGIAGTFIYSQYKANSPAGAYVTVEPNSYPLAEGLALGAADAPVRIDAWEDFQCPACRRFAEGTLPLVVENYVATGKVRYTFHQYPFLDGNGAGNGGESDQAANASMCANEQGEFWTYHDILFANWNGENQGAFGKNRLRAFAESLNLDMAAFDECFDSNAYETDIEDDFRAGVQIGVEGTPSIFVNGQKVGQPGSVPSYDEIAAAVEAALPAPTATP